ncbi:hypothetical protein [Arthrobacter sp. CAN_A1]|uniref:hypothetical protein n=1 Tax=Arthrobacter sp. CAN_A1 TaxID=2787717 RepID=UPI001A1F9ECD
MPDRPLDGNVLDAAAVLTTAQEQELNSLFDERNVDTDMARVAVLTVENVGGGPSRITPGR